MTTASIGSLLDHYKIIEVLGRGGMGVVYKALNIHLDKIVAIKTIALGLSSHENFINRFQTEARALAKLEDPNIVRIYDLRVDDDQWYIVMEYVEGGTLADRIRGNKAIPYLSALPIMKQLLNAIGHAHRVGIIHRDIKPTNVMITRDGIVKVTDFGLAKDQQHHNNTIAGSTGGTLYYMSPEQVKGLFYTDHRSDIYSLGLTFYEMLAGKIPFRKDDTDFAIREAIIKRRFPPPSHFNPDIPVALNSIIMRAIEKNPDQRYQGVNEMLESVIKFEKHQTFWAPTAPKQIYNPDTVHDISKIPTPPETQQISYVQSGSRQKPKVNLWKWISASFLLPFLIWIALTNFHPNHTENSDQPLTFTIRSDPDAAFIISNGDTLGRTPVFNALLPAGTANLLITKENFLSLDTTMLIDSQKNSTLIFQLQSKVPPEIPIAEINSDIPVVPKDINDSHGKIHIKTEPPGALVYQDGTFIGISPLEKVNLRGGLYEFQVKKEGYATETRHVQISSGESESLNLILTMQIVSAHITSEPDGADILVNGIPVPNVVTPSVINDLAPGVYQITLRKPGYIPYKTELELKTGISNQLSATLFKATGKIRLLIKPWGSIYIDEQIRKENTNVSFSETLDEGDHLVTVIHPTFGTWEKKITISPGETQDFIVDFSQTVNVRVTAFDTEGRPVWADIIVDDELTGNMTPKEIAVRIGRRTFSAEKEGYEMVGGSLSLMLDKNLNEPLKFILRRRF
jgi:serine/threonine protein kinase